MSTRRIAGWISLASGLLLVAAVGASAIAAPPRVASGAPGGYGMMAPGMMGAGHMGPGMMGFGNAGPAPTAIPGATEVRITASNFGFTPSEIHLAKGTDVNLTLSNPAATGVAHDLTVPALGIHLVANAGETRTIGLRNLAAGRYDAYCSVPGHADLGMRAIVVVD